MAVIDTEESNPFAGTAWAQIGSEAAMHSLSAGMIVHRVGLVNYDLLDDARSFALDLAGYMNRQLSEDATTLVYEEVFGQIGRMHWLVHLKHPGDYGQLLEMADHDQDFKSIYESDRLPSRGGGNWEKMFLQGSFQERILAPQHGYGKEALDEMAEGSFVPPARHQSSLAADDLLNSGTAAYILLRSVQARYESRDLARYYLYEWQTEANELLKGSLNGALYEEIWGRQDRLHQLLHLGSLDHYMELVEAERGEGRLNEVVTQNRVEIGGEPHGWGGLFEAGTLNEVVLRPLLPVSAAS